MLQPMLVQQFYLIPFNRLYFPSSSSLTFFTWLIKLKEHIFIIRFPLGGFI